jgi:hypothetical protein
MANPKFKTTNKTGLLGYDGSQDKWVAISATSGGGIIVEGDGLSGPSTDGSITLNPADTWVQVPTSAPTSSYALVVTPEVKTGTLRWSFDDGGIPSSSNGNRFAGDSLIVEMAGGEVIYFGSTVNTDVVNFTTKEL